MKHPEVTIYLHPKGFVGLKGGRVLSSHNAENLEANVRAMHQWLAGEPRQVFLSASLCRPFLASVPGGLTPQESERAWAVSAAARTGVSADCVVWRAPQTSNSAVPGHKQVAAALESRLLRSLLVEPIPNPPGKSRRSRVVSIQPAWAEWLRVSLAHEPDASCVVLDETDGVTVLAGQGGGFEVASTVLRNSDAVAEQAALDRLLLVAVAPGQSPRTARLNARAAETSSRLASKLAGILETLN